MNETHQNLPWRITLSLVAVGFAAATLTACAFGSNWSGVDRIGEPVDDTGSLDMEVVNRTTAPGTLRFLGTSDQTSYYAGRSVSKADAACLVINDDQTAGYCGTSPPLTVAFDDGRTLIFGPQRPGPDWSELFDWVWVEADEAN